MSFLAKEKCQVSILFPSFIYRYIDIKFWTYIIYIEYSLSRNIFTSSKSGHHWKNFSLRHLLQQMQVDTISILHVFRLVNFNFPLTRILLGFSNLAPKRQRNILHISFEVLKLYFHDIVLVLLILFYLWLK